MSEKNALALSIGILGAAAVWLTGAWVTVPVWAVFIAWASFFILGGGSGGLLRSMLSNLAGVLIAALALLVSEVGHFGLALTGVAVALLLGGLFGLVSEQAAALLARRTPVPAEQEEAT